ncbi:MAG TPA: glutathione binding-like protein [Aggregicoccus sp.]|nr:glutathione binding-like protein [Aggregicoccus sp.]
MIDLYFSPTPNGLKIRLFLEETGLAYRIVPVRLSAGEQFAPAFLALSPNNKIPAIVDHAPQDGGAPLPVFESGAILLYLAEKCGQLLPEQGRARLEALQWLFWQVSGLGPMAGQAGYFRVFAPGPVPAAIERYTRELSRLYGVLERRLEGRDYLAGNAYSIADIACYPWVVPHRAHGQELTRFTQVQRWFERISQRAATRRVYEGVEDVYAAKPALSDQARATLFQQDAAALAR